MTARRGGSIWNEEKQDSAPKGHSSRAYGRLLLDVPHCPAYGTGESVVVDWDMASPLRKLHPVEEDCRSTFADATKLQILDVATQTVQWEATFPTAGNAPILVALGAEVDFIVRAWNQRAGLNSINHSQIKVTKQ